MMRLLKLRSVAIIATIALMGGTAFVASGATGAYFSQSVPGTVQGTAGSIHIDTTASNGQGGNGLQFTLSDLLPGTPQTFRINYENSGISPEDVWVVFNQSDLNDLNFANSTTALATVKIRSTGGAAWGLSDLFATPLPQKIKLHSNLASGASGYTNVSFGIAAGVTDQAGAATALNAAVMHYNIVATQVGISPGA